MSHFTAQSFIFFGFIVAGEEIESKLRSLCIVFIYLACCLRSVWRVVTFSMAKPNFNVIYLGYDRNDLVRLSFTSEDVRSLQACRTWNISYKISYVGDTSSWVVFL